MKTLKIFTVFVLISGQVMASPIWQRPFESSVREINCIEFSQNCDIGYIGTDSGLFVTYNGGKTWENTDFRSSIIGVKDIAILGDKVYVLTQKGLYEKGKEEWRSLSVKRGAKGITSNGNNSLSKILLWTDKKLYYLKGEDWIDIGKDIARQGIDNVISWENKIFVSSGGRVFSSFDGGETWGETFLLKTYEQEEFSDESSEEVYESDSGIVSLAYSALSGLVIGTRKGVFVISDSESLPVRIDTSGLPAGKVVWAINISGNIFVSTEDRVFYYNAEAEEWRVIFKKVTGGRIIALDLSLSAEGNKLLWVVTETDVYSRKADIILYNSGKDIKEETINREPSILEVQKMAIEYAEVSPEKIEAWRRGAKWKAIMPRLSVSFSESIYDNVDIYKNSNLSYVVQGPKEKGNDWGVDLSWDLTDIIWNNEQTSIDVRSKLMVQMRGEILEDLTRIYFERKRLLEEFDRISPENPIEISQKKLRVMELTAYIDAFTGGGFSAALGKK